LLWCFRHGFQFKDVLLDPLQEPRVLGIQIRLKDINLLVALTGLVIAVQQTDVVPALLTPRSQKRVHCSMQAVRRQIGQSLTSCMTMMLEAKQLPLLNDVSPVVLTRIRYTDHDLAEFGERFQGFQDL